MQDRKPSPRTRSLFLLAAIAGCLVGAAFATGPQEHLIYTFPGQPNAAGPTSTLIADTAGQFIRHHCGWRDQRKLYLVGGRERRMRRDFRTIAEEWRGMDGNGFV
jgi:hypothetical protein